MSFGIIRIQKMKAGHVKGIQIHDQREKDFSHSNQDIDFSKSHLNIDLKNAANINFTKTVNERIKSLKLPKAVRKDAVVMCQCLITSDNEFFSNMEESKQKEFFNNAYDFIKKRYGEENIISGTVHYDETTPHLHVNFVPVTSDGRLSAKDLFKKQDLHKLHDDFYKFNLNHGYNLERGETKEEKKDHLSVEQYKIKTGLENVKESQEELQTLKDEIYKLKNELNKALKDYKDINLIDVKKNIITRKINMEQKEFDNLKLLAQRGVLSIDENNILIKRCEVAEKLLDTKTLELDKINKILDEKEKALSKTKEELNSTNRIKNNMTSKLGDYDKVFNNAPQVKKIVLNLLNFLNSEEFTPSPNIEKWLGVSKEEQEKRLSDIETLKEIDWEQDM